MYIDTIYLTCFRNYEHLELRPSRGLNILVGPNAQGKSAVLEALYLLATSKSHRTSKDIDLIRLGDPIARACVEVRRSNRNDAFLEIILSRQEKKTVRINKVKPPKIGDLLGQLNAVIFSNSDIDMVRGEPSLRRRFLNLEISQISPQYIYALGRYKRVLDQRNNLLKELKQGSGKASDLEMWDSQLCQYGASVMARRAKFIDFLASAAAKIYDSLTDQSEEFKITYKPNIDIPAQATEKDIEKAYLKKLSYRRENDIFRGTTSSGPHRDDILLTISGLPAKEFASQGQQRSAAIAMKLAEIELIEQSTQESPVVLLDDVMAELDETRRSRILQITAGKCQTFITTTSLDDLGGGALDSASIFEVKAGKVTAI